MAAIRPLEALLAQLHSVCIVGGKFAWYVGSQWRPVCNTLLWPRLLYLFCTSYHSVQRRPKDVAWMDLLSGFSTKEQSQRALFCGYPSEPRWLPIASTAGCQLQWAGWIRNVDMLLVRELHLRCSCPGSWRLGPNCNGNTYRLRRMPHTLLRQKGYKLPIGTETLPKLENATLNKVLRIRGCIA